MSLDTSSSLFLFSNYDKNNSKILDKDINNSYEKQINEFLNTWFIFSCKNGSCNCKSNLDKNVNLTKNNYNVVEHAFYMIFGDKYINNTLRYIIPKLNRFRHILKEEDNPSFELCYKDYKINNLIFKRVLSEKDKSIILSKYKAIYRYYSSIYNESNETLMNSFNLLINEITKNYIENNSFENKVLPFIEENIFYNNGSYENLRSKVLVIMYELISRYYESINIDPYSTTTPTTQYVDGFFKIQKSVISNDTLYIFLRDSQNVLVYDLSDKFLNDENSFKFQKLTPINKAHKLYLLSFNSQIINMVYNKDNIILILKDGNFIINGKNTNNKINDSEKENFGFFTSFIYGDITDISNIKIYNNHIYLINNNNEIFIYGNMNNENPLYKDSILVDSNIYKNTSYTKYSNFTLSDNEKNIKFLNKDTLGKFYEFNSFELEIVNDNTIKMTSTIETENNEIIHEFENDTNTFKITNIFRLVNDAFIVEIIDNNKNYHYNISGIDADKTCRLGFTYEAKRDFDLLSLSYELGTNIQLDSSNNFNNARISSIYSSSERTIILMDNGNIYGAGINNGYFITVDSLTKLDEFCLINNPNVDEKFTEILATESLNKPLIFAYNENYAVGFGSLYILGMKNGSTFKYTDVEVKEKLDDTSLDNSTDKNRYAYFCTKNCINFINPLYDLLSYFYLSNLSFKDSSIDHVIQSLLFLKDMSISYNEEAYEHMVNNLTILSNDTDPTIIGMNQSILLFSNLQNYTMHDSMILMYSNDEYKYNCISKFINMIGLMSENFSAMKVKKTKIGQLSFDDFINELNDINSKSYVEIEEKLYGVRKSR